MRWSAVDLTKGTVQVQVGLQRTKEGYGLVPPKTKKSRRLVMLTEPAKEALNRHGSNQTAERLLAGDYWKNELDPTVGPHDRKRQDAGVRVVRLTKVEHRAWLQDIAGSALDQ